MADYSNLVTALKAKWDAADSPVIAFGGSYGGMLASWWRMQYPHIVDGAIAGSAPILDFEPVVDAEGIESFSHIVTRDASPEGGSNANCAPNVWAAWPIIADLATTPAGRRTLAQAFGLCANALPTEDDVGLLLGWLQSAWAYMAMGDYPFPSTYILNGQGVLPAWPVRVACEALDFPTEAASNATLLEGMRAAVSVYYNATADVACYDLHAGVNEESQVVEDHWNRQFCSEMFMPSGSDGVHDMFWPAPWDGDAQADYCFARFGVQPRRTWAATVYGGRKALATASNIVFSNGLLDPWSGTGVLESVSDSVVALLLKEGAHHLDLMFSTPDDPQELIDVRQAELGYIRQWIEEAAAARQAQGAAVMGL